MTSNGKAVMVSWFPIHDDRDRSLDRWRQTAIELKMTSGMSTNSSTRQDEAGRADRSATLAR